MKSSLRNAPRCEHPRRAARLLSRADSADQLPQLSLPAHHSQQGPLPSVVACVLFVGMPAKSHRQMLHTLSSLPSVKRQVFCVGERLRMVDCRHFSEQGHQQAAPQQTRFPHTSKMACSARFVPPPLHLRPGRSGPAQPAPGPATRTPAAAAWRPGRSRAVELRSPPTPPPHSWPLPLGPDRARRTAASAASPSGVRHGHRGGRGCCRDRSGP